jgi:hypothetical protein
MATDRLEIADSVLSQELQDEVVLLNMSNQQYYGLNDVAARMWKTLLERGSVDKAIDPLCQLYNVEQTVVRTDLELLVRDLVSAGLLKEAAEPGPCIP